MIRIKLKNFRCYRDHEFIIQKKKSNLITGLSGKGKTTIFQAILFALYGCVKKPHSFGAKNKKCVVTLTDDDTIIMRQKNPNLLVVQNKKGEVDIQDDVAQGYIDKKYGTQYLFIHSSYLMQSKKHLFFSGSNNDKLELIRKIGFTEDNVSDVKKRIHERIKKVKNDILGVEFSKKATKKSLDSFMNENSEIKEVDDNKEKELLNLEIEKDFIEKLETGEEKLKKNLNHIISLETEVKLIKKTIAVIKDELKNIDDFNESDIQDIEKENKELEDEKQELEKKLSNYDSEVKSKKKIVSNLNEKIQKLQDKKKIIEEDLSKASEDVKALSLEDLIKQKKRYGKYVEICDKYNVKSLEELEKKVKTTEERIEELNDDITLVKELMDKQVDGVDVTCPHCKKDLIFMKDDERLEKREGKTTQDVDEDQKKEYRDNIKEVKYLTKTLDKIQDSIKLIKDEKLDVEFVHEDRIKLFENLGLISSDIVRQSRTRDNITIIENELTDEQVEEFESKIEDLDVRIRNNKKTLKKLHTQKSTKERLEKKLKEKEDELKEIQDEIGDQNSEEIQRRIDDIKTKVADATKKLKLQKLLKYKKSLTDELNTHDEKLKEVKKLYETLIYHKEKASEVESNILVNAVDTLNIEINNVLETIYNDPIVVELRTIKEVKNKKEIRFTFSIKIFYNNCMYDSITQLSGGEQDRISFAFFVVKFLR